MRIIQAEEGMKMIEDYIMDVLSLETYVGVHWIVAVTREALDCTEDEVQDAIIRLEDQGRVKGFMLDGIPQIEAVKE